MDHAIQTETNETIDTETSRPLNELTEVGDAVTDVAAGMVVDLRGAIIARDFTVIEQRMNKGENGAWVVANLAVEGPENESAGQLAVALGWAPNSGAARVAMHELESQADTLLGGEVLDLTGRYMPPEAPVVPKPGTDISVIESMAPAQLANTWQRVNGPVYSGFLVLHNDPAQTSPELVDVIERVGLEPIDSVAPLPQEKVNWLNLFYAVEWVVFGGFAIFFWFRLTRDAWEKAHELQQLREAEGS